MCDLQPRTIRSSSSNKLSLVPISTNCSKINSCRSSIEPCAVCKKSFSAERSRKTYKSSEPKSPRYAEIGSLTIRWLVIFHVHRFWRILSGCTSMQNESLNSIAGITMCTTVRECWKCCCRFSSWSQVKTLLAAPMPVQLSEMPFNKLSKTL